MRVACGRNDGREGGRERGNHALLAVVATGRGRPCFGGAMTDHWIGGRVTQPTCRALSTTRRVPGACTGLGLHDAHVVVFVICQAHAVLVGVRQGSVVLVHGVIGLAVIEVRVVLVCVIAVGVRLPPVSSEKEFDVCAHLEILDVARKTIPGQVAVVKSLFDEGGRPKVDIMDKVMERRGVGDWEMNDRMRARGRREDAWKPWRRHG